MDETTRSTIIGALIATIPILLTQLFVWLNAKESRTDAIVTEKRQYRRQLEERDADYVLQALNQLGEALHELKQAAFVPYYPKHKGEPFKGLEVALKLYKSLNKPIESSSILAKSLSNNVNEAYTEVLVSYDTLLGLLGTRAVEKATRPDLGELDWEAVNKYATEVNTHVERIHDSIARCRRAIRQHLAEAAWENS